MNLFLKASPNGSNTKSGLKWESFALCTQQHLLILSLSMDRRTL